MMIKIYDGVPRFFNRLYWLKDYAKFGVTMQILFNPLNRFIGVGYKKKGYPEKSIILSPEENNEFLAKKRFLEIEAMFDIPASESKYSAE